MQLIKMDIQELAYKMRTQKQFNIIIKLITESRAPNIGSRIQDGMILGLNEIK